MEFESNIRDPVCGQQAIDVAVQIFADGLAHDLAGCLFEKRVQRVFLAVGFKVHDLTLEFLRFLLDKGFDALFVGTVTARFTLFCIPVLRSKGNVQTDVLSLSIFFVSNNMLICCLLCNILDV